MADDDIALAIGHWGRFQLYNFLLIWLCKVPMAWSQLAIIYLAPNIPYTCPGQESMDDPESEVRTCPCDNPKFQSNEFHDSMITEWKLICKDAWKSSIHQTCFQLGVLIGSLVLGALGDRFGRRKPFLFAITMGIVIGLIGVYLKNYYLFTFMRFFVGFSVGGIQVISFVYVIEYVGNKYRETVATLYHVPFILGHLTLPIFSYLLKEFRKTLLATTLVSTITLVYFFILNESPMWLIAVDKMTPAIKIYEGVAKISSSFSTMNETRKHLFTKKDRQLDNLPLTKVALYMNRRDVSAVKGIIEEYKNKMVGTRKKGRIQDLFKTPNIRKYNLIMGTIWFTTSFCYYGLSQYVAEVPGNVYVNVALSASLALAGNVLGLPLMLYVNRKTLLFGVDGTAAIALFSAIFLRGSNRAICASIGVMCSFFKFVIVYMFGGELFPTAIRNMAIGFASMSARLGSLIAPLVIYTKETDPIIPPIIFLSAPLLSIVVTTFLPETKNVQLMNTIEEGEAFTKESSREQRRAQS